MHQPSVIETIGRSSRSYDLPTKLLQNRIVYLGEPITPEIANSTIQQLLWLNSDNPDSDIELYINCPGGSVYDGLAIKDVIDNLSCTVNTVGTGMCASMGSYLLAGGTGTRRATKNCRIMLHSVSSGSYGTYNDLAVDFKETEYLQKKLLNNYTEFTNGILNKQKINKMTQRDTYLSPEESIELGLIDSIV